MGCPFGGHYSPSWASHCLLELHIEISGEELLATEQESLGIKEALVKFQPFVKGEKNIIITDHTALIWAWTYENANRRLVAWGTVFGAFLGLDIVHRAGKVHSNIDPLSRLPRILPHQSPAIDKTKP